MTKSGVIINITKEPRGYGAHALIENIPIDTYGNTLAELQETFIETVNSKFGNENESYHVEDIQFTIDLQSFFDYYKDFHVTGSEEHDWNMMKTLGPAY